MHIKLLRHKTMIMEQKTKDKILTKLHERPEGRTVVIVEAAFCEP